MIQRMLLFAVLFFTAAWATAEEAKEPSADETALRKNTESYVAAYNHRDAKALAAHFAEQGSYNDPITGERLVGREAIEKLFTELFTDENKPQLSVKIDSVRLLDDKVAVEEGTATVVSIDTPPEVTSYLAVHVKKDGKWYLDSVRETLVPEEPTDTSTPLDDLDWMVGRWVDESETASVETSCKWSANNKFLTRSFVVAVQGEPVMAGTQIIGWDPAEKRIRSWTFDSEGAFGEGHWTQQDNRWLVKATNTLGDGRKATAVQIITKIDDDSFTWQSVGRQVDGEILPNVDPITIVRAAAE